MLISASGREAALSVTELVSLSSVACVCVYKWQKCLYCVHESSSVLAFPRLRVNDVEVLPLSCFESMSKLSLGLTSTDRGRHKSRKSCVEQGHGLKVGTAHLIPPSVG